MMFYEMPTWAKYYVTPPGPATVVVPIDAPPRDPPPVCVACGEWKRCICPRVSSPMTAHCYLCDAQHDPRVPPPRVCEQCRARYMP